MVQVLTSSSHMSLPQFQIPRIHWALVISFSPAFNHLLKFFWALSSYSHASKGGHQTYSLGFSHGSQQCHKMNSQFINCSSVKKFPFSSLSKSSCKAFPASFSRVQLPQTGPACLGPKFWIHWHCTEPLWAFHGCHSPKYSETRKS